MKHSLHILDRTGDTTFTWSPDDVNATLKAMEAFEEARGAKHLIYRDDGEGNRVAVLPSENFDPEAPGYVAVPQLMGG